MSIEITPVWKEIQSTWSKLGLKGVFVEILGWEPRSDLFKIYDETPWECIQVANLNGFAIIQVQSDSLPSRSQINKLYQLIGQRFPERIVVFTGPKSFVWIWPKRLPTGSITTDSIEVSADEIPQFLCQRLVGLKFGIDQLRKGVTLANIRDKVHGSFDSSAVTKNFFKKFADEHLALASQIRGIPLDAASGYATLMLNRLMFVYFLQKKEFINGDPNYLSTCLKKVRELNGKDRFYSFYRHYLLPLFFDYLDSPKQGIDDPKIRAIVGSVPYVNGGLFGETVLETRHNIEIPDTVFESIFSFFDKFTWHLDTRPSGASNEINPEVLGYIFEQYISYEENGKKLNGAYYTQTDVTGYMVGNTLVPRLLQECAAIGLNPFVNLATSTTRYIHQSRLHGFIEAENRWLPLAPALEKCWAGEPEHWDVLDDEPHNPEIQLPDESLVECLARRDSVNELLSKIASGSIESIDELTTLNLNQTLILADLISTISETDNAIRLWERISAITVIDPTCGSGAFLFTALEVLEDVYHNLLTVIESASVSGPDVNELLARVSAHPNRNYFVRKHVALRNLYGLDLMPGAIETAKLRIFLSLAACLESVEQIEPLPDLDFNLKAGNLLVGFKDPNDVFRVGDGDLFAHKDLEDLELEAVEFTSKYLEFIKASEVNSENISELKVDLQTISMQLASQCDEKYAVMTGLRQVFGEDWIEQIKPFHWFVEFPGIVARGGFDVVIGNPPYISLKRGDHVPRLRSTLHGYKTLATADLYAVCYERSLALLKPDGRHGFIVPVNSAWSEEFDELREILDVGRYSQWWSTYSKRPGSLFPVQIRNSIIILGPGSSRWATAQNVFSNTGRPYLFQNLQYFANNATGHKPLCRAGQLNELVESIMSSKATFGPSASKSVFTKETATYWMPVLFARPNKVDRNLKIIGPDNDAPEIKLSQGENADLLASVLAGKIGYLFWSAVGDDMHVNPNREVSPIRKFLLENAEKLDSEDLAALSNKVKEASLEIGFVSVNLTSVVNIRWNSARAVTDLFDKAFLIALGLDSHWKMLNIWYRQNMKSSGDNLNSINLTREQAQRIIPLT